MNSRTAGSSNIKPVSDHQGWSRGMTLQQKGTKNCDGSVLHVGFGIGFMTIYNYQIYQMIYLKGVTVTEITPQ